jgi:hypothetical protein
VGLADVHVKQSNLAAILLETCLHRLEVAKPGLSGSRGIEKEHRRAVDEVGHVDEMSVLVHPLIQGSLFTGPNLGFGDRSPEDSRQQRTADLHRAQHENLPTSCPDRNHT